MRQVIFFAALCCAATGAAPAATLKAFTEIDRPTVMLSDLFAGIDPASDHVLGPSPAPGAQIIVPSAQLAAIAREDGVDWQPRGSEAAIISRPGVILAKADVVPLLRAALLAAGAAPDSDMLIEGFAPLLVPRDGKAALDITDLSYSTSSGRFTALLRVGESDMAPLTRHLAGEMIAMIPAIAPRQRLSAGTVLDREMLRDMRVPRQSLLGRDAVEWRAAIGMALKRSLAPDTPITTVDLERPQLVTRGNLVRLVFREAGLNVEAGAIALSSGGAHDQVTVENPSSHAKLFGEVLEDGTIRINAPRILASASVP
jgi:flagella basal body P-ring formation protein FlgA